MATRSDGQIDTVMHESRVFPPPAEFAAQARVKSLDEYQQLWDRAAAERKSTVMGEFAF
jgi:acetyl-CoA synthetase